MTVIVALACLVAAPVLLLARHGGEAYEMTTAPDRAAVKAAYAAAGDVPTVFVADNRSINTFAGPSVAEWIVVGEDEGDWNTCQLSRIVSVADEARAENVLVVLTNAQSAWATHLQGRDKTYLDKTAAWLLAQPGTEIVHQDEGTWVLDLNPTGQGGAECGTS